MSIKCNDLFLEKSIEIVNEELDTKGGHFFEGAEKLLEIWFYDPQQLLKESELGVKNYVVNKELGFKPSLRNIPREEFVKMLEIACCHILHTKSNNHIDSYVLSESSMFVSDRRFILKTCGTTNLLRTVTHIINLAMKYAGLYAVANVYYSRKNFLRPHLQPELHQCFDGEVDHLDNYFQDGGAYCMGSLRHDRWYLYTMNNPQAPPICADHSLEILMSDIPQDVLNVFSKAECKSGKECTRRGGISQLVPPTTIIHEELFEPVGYSMNGLIPDSDEYVTIHITPEPKFSYVSFETNQHRQCLYKQTLKVLDCFKPNRFILILFSNDLSENGKDTQMRIWRNEIPGYKRVNMQILRLQYDTLVYAHFKRDKDEATGYCQIRRIIDDNRYKHYDDYDNQSD